MTAAVLAEAWHLHHVMMTIELGDDLVVVDTTSHFARMLGGTAEEVTLDGRGLELLALSVDGDDIDLATVQRDDRSLRIHLGPGDEHVVSYRVSSAPGGPNDEGFTSRPTLLSTNCEPTGFRRITYFLDRPGNRATYDVPLVGDPVRYPTMLCNGDLVGSGVLVDGRAWARFVDPVPKPSYLFAVVAGLLQSASARYTTSSGRQLELRVAAPPEQTGGATYALETMAQVIAFDEAHGGIEHDLDVLTFVSIPGYPDATEYHGLMFFESAVLMVDTRGYVDDDLLGIVANVAHEYGHHVRGNRVTVRSWDQLALKEGLTVLTAQNDFRRHLLGPVGRVLDVLDLRRLQFPEEVTIGAPVLRGEVADPHQLYTRTTYLKAAEIFGMIRTVMGPKLWSEVFGKFVQRHDLSAAGVDDFVSLAQEVAPVLADDLEGIARWFHLAGRPSITIATSHFPGSVEIAVERTDELTDDPPVAIPIVLGFRDETGAPTPVEIAGTTSTTHLVLVGSREQHVVAQCDRPVIVSALRGYSAPVDLRMSVLAADLATLMAYDDDAYTRWWASQELMIRVVDAHRAGNSSEAEHAVGALVGGLRQVIRDERDPALVAQLLAPPDEFALGDREPLIDVDGVARGLGHLRREVGAALHSELLALIGAQASLDHAATTPAGIASRMLWEPVLGYLLAAGSVQGVAAAERELASPNATRAVRALTQLAHRDDLPLDEYLTFTRLRWAGAPKLIDRWLRAQTGARRADTIERVSRLAASDLYDRHDRARVMAIWFPFCTRNRSVFHHASGAGYRLFVDEVSVLMPLNPGLVVRLVGDLLQFHRFDEHRRELMRAELSRMAGMPGMPDFAVGLVRQLLAH